MQASTLEIFLREDGGDHILYYDSRMYTAIRVLYFGCYVASTNMPQGSEVSPRTAHAAYPHGGAPGTEEAHDLGIILVAYMYQWFIMLI